MDKFKSQVLEDQRLIGFVRKRMWWETIFNFKGICQSIPVQFKLAYSFIHYLNSRAILSMNQEIKLLKIYYCEVLKLSLAVDKETATGKLTTH